MGIYRWGFKKGPQRHENSIHLSFATNSEKVQDAENDSASLERLSKVSRDSQSVALVFIMKTVHNCKFYSCIPLIPHQKLQKCLPWFVRKSFCYFFCWLNCYIVKTFPKMAKHRVCHLILHLTLKILGSYDLYMWNNG